MPTALPPPPNPRPSQTGEQLPNKSPVRNFVDLCCTVLCACALATFCVCVTCLCQCLCACAYVCVPVSALTVPGIQIRQQASTDGRPPPPAVRVALIIQPAII